jgi:rubredoxin
MTTDAKLTTEMLDHVVSKQEDAYRRHRSQVALTHNEADALIAAARASLESRGDAENTWKVGQAIEPIPMRLMCPCCGELHIDEGEFATRVHHTHACQRCGHVWRPAVVATVGVRFLPGFQNEEPTNGR